MDPRLDENEAELGVLVATVALEVLADGHGLLDKHVKVLRDLGGETCQKFSYRMREFLNGGGRGAVRRSVSKSLTCVTLQVRGL